MLGHQSSINPACLLPRLMLSFQPPSPLSRASRASYISSKVYMFRCTCLRSRARHRERQSGAAGRVSDHIRVVPAALHTEGAASCCLVTDTEARHRLCAAHRVGGAHTCDGRPVQIARKHVLVLQREWQLVPLASSGSLQWAQQTWRPGMTPQQANMPSARRSDQCLAVLCSPPAERRPLITCVDGLQKGAGAAATTRTSRRVRGAAPASSGLTDDFREPSDGERALWPFDTCSRRRQVFRKNRIAVVAQE